MKIKNSQSGYTMLESIMYIGLLMMVVIAFVSVVHKMYGRYKISRMTSQVVEIAKAISDRCVASASYAECIGSNPADNMTGKMATFLCNENLQPKEMKCTFVGTVGAHLRYRGVHVTLEDMESTPGREVEAGKNYVVRYKLLTKQECVELATFDVGSNQYIDLDSVYFYNNEGMVFKWKSDLTSNATIWQKNHTLPISNAAAVEMCSGTNGVGVSLCDDTPKETCSIAWVFD